MTPQSWATLFVLFGVLLALVFSRRGADVVLLGGWAMLLVIPLPRQEGGWQWGVFENTADGLRGFSNEGMLTIAVLFVVAAGLRETGGMEWIAHRLLGRPKSLPRAQVRIVGPAAVLSAFLNNTPLVAMMMPTILDWARRHQLSVSKLLLPLSYASILGGSCTLIGTSTNLIVNGWMLEQREQFDPTFAGIGMFEVTWVALPIAAVAIGVMLLLSRWLIPDRVSARNVFADSREYTVEMMVEPASPLAGITIEEAGLRHLPGLFLMEIQRDANVIPAPSANVKLQENDRLVFAGVVESVVDLQKIRGLVPATTQVFKLDEPRVNRSLVEAVVSNTCPLVGLTIREGRFRTRYNAAVIAVARNGHRIAGKIGDIRLQPGDTLLLEARASFAEQQRNSRDFFLVSQVENSTPPRHERAGIAMAILAVMVVLVTAGWMSMLQAALVAAGAMLLTRCCRAGDARRAIDWQVLIVIAASIGIGHAMEQSGLAAVMGDRLIDWAGTNGRVVLAAIFGATMVLAAAVNSKAAAVLMLPVALEAANTLGAGFYPFAIAVMLAAATTIATPIGYPTNLMVMGPGGYRFSDYLRVGLPLSLLIWAMAVWLIPMKWPL